MPVLYASGVFIYSIFFLGESFWFQKLISKVWALIHEVWAHCKLSDWSSSHKVFKNQNRWLGGGFKYVLFSPLFGEDEPIWTNIFQRGWSLLFGFLEGDSIFLLLCSLLGNKSTRKKSPTIFGDLFLLELFFHKHQNWKMLQIPWHHRSFFVKRFSTWNRGVCPLNFGGGNFHPPNCQGLNSNQSKGHLGSNPTNRQRDLKVEVLQIPKVEPTALPTDPNPPIFLGGSQKTLILKEW